ncbi:MAG: hypothetical protein JW955_20775 [Sedimentisphaerales bacterium]|nr:hypothetical protein [Sedimentisphaerales bacterium]
MAQMFCTLKQAADKLNTTEAQVETMLNDGLLREFRDGSSRLLKVADLAGMVASPSSADGGRSARARHKTRAARPGHMNRTSASFDAGIRLPAAPVATITMKSPRAVNAKHPTRRVRPSSTPRQVMHAPRRQTCTKPRQRPPRAVVISPPVALQRPRRKTHEMSLRQWLWTGLLDDSPIAIFIIFGTVLLIACAVAGAAYLLVRTL